MQKITLTKNKECIVDDSMYVKLMSVKWHTIISRGIPYAATNLCVNGKRRTVKMHRYILGLLVGDGGVVDHINGDTLDNRKCNLRITDVQGNTRNCKLRIDSKSGYKGVSVRTRKSGEVVYEAYIHNNSTRLHLGTFRCAEEAAREYDKKAQEIYGEFARTNRVAIQEAERISKKEAEAEAKKAKKES